MNEDLLLFVEKHGKHGMVKLGRIPHPPILIRRGKKYLTPKKMILLGLERLLNLDDNLTKLNFTLRRVCMSEVDREHKGREPTTVIRIHH